MQTDMPEQPVVIEIFQLFNRDGELSYDDMIKYIMNTYEVTEKNAKRLYKLAEDLYDEVARRNWILDYNEMKIWTKNLPRR